MSLNTNTPLSLSVILHYIKEDRQCTQHDITVTCIDVTIITWRRSIKYEVCVCVLALVIGHACNILYCYLWPIWL